MAPTGRFVDMAPSGESSTANGFAFNAGLLTVSAGIQLVAFDLALPA